MSILLAKPIFLIVICAIAYAVATFAMKQASDAPNVLLYAMIALCFSVAAITEIIVLRQMNLGIAYILILATESLLVVSLAGLVGEGFGPRELAGAGLVLVGTAILSA